MRDDQRLVVGVVEHFVTRGANVVLGTSAGDALPHRAVSRREMVNVTVVQRVPGVVFGQPRRIPATGTNAMMVVVLHWKKQIRIVSSKRVGVRKQTQRLSVIIFGKTKIVPKHYLPMVMITVPGPAAVN